MDGNEGLEKHEHHEHPEHHYGHAKTWRNFLPQFAIVAVACLAIGVLAAGMIPPKAAEAQGIGEVAVAQAVEAYVNARLPEGVTSTVTSIELKNGIYELTVDFVQDGSTVQTIPAYASLDGKTMYTGAFDLTEAAPTPSPVASPTPEAELVKSARPVAELFVMSYCPYGTQFEKAIIPVRELLANYTDFELKFVYYTMHGAQEVNENTRQYCIEKEYGNETMWDYLECFLAEGDSSGCLNASQLNATLLDECVAATHEEFAIDTAGTEYGIYLVDNQAYAVGGSPTFVLNGKVMSVARSPEAIKQAVCSAFIDAPDACDEVLSETAATAGFGYEAGSTSSGSCS
ncbi:MAG: hypothetical protein WC607_00875 [Candidatus Micrarchaeia archaeon]